MSEEARNVLGRRSYSNYERCVTICHFCQFLNLIQILLRVKAENMSRRI